MQHVEAGLIGGKPGAHFLHAANGRTAMRPSGSRLQGQPQCSRWSNSLGISLQSTRPHPDRRASRCLKWCRSNVRRCYRLCRRRRQRRPRRDRMAAHRIDLGNHRDAEFGILLRDFDRGPQAGTTAADYQNVMRGRFHCLLRFRRRSAILTDPALNTLTVVPLSYQERFRRRVKRPDYSAAFSGSKRLWRFSTFSLSTRTLPSFSLIESPSQIRCDGAKLGIFNPDRNGRDYARERIRKWQTRQQDRTHHRRRIGYRPRHLNPFRQRGRMRRGRRWAEDHAQPSLPTSPVKAARRLR